MANTRETQTELSNEGYIEALLFEKGIEAPKILINILVSVLKKVPDLNQSVIVSLLNELSINMFGKEISQKISTQSGRKTYQIHPYRKAGSGAVCMATYSDSNGESYVLLGQKKPRGNIQDKHHILLGGYFQPYPLANHIPDIENLTSEQKDIIEEAIRSGIKDAYQKMANETPVESKAIPVEIKPKPIVYDKNVRACSQRELKEESGLDLTDIEPEFLLEQSDYPNTNPDLHSINLSYLFHLGTTEATPQVKPGSDIESLKWIGFKEIEMVLHNDGNQYFFNSEMIRNDHGPVLEKGAEFILNQRIKAITRGKQDLNTLQATLIEIAQDNKQVLDSILGDKPQTYFGHNASHYYKKLEKVAEEFQKCSQEKKLFDLDRLRSCLEGKTTTQNKYLWFKLFSFTAAVGAGLVAYNATKPNNKSFTRFP